MNIGIYFSGLFVTITDTLLRLLIASVGWWVILAWQVVRWNDQVLFGCLVRLFLVLGG